MTLCEPLSLTALPAHSEIPVDQEQAGYAYSKAMHGSLYKLFDLPGNVAGRQHEGHEAREVGELAGHALLRGDVLNTAILFGLAAAAYDRAIASLAHRVANAMRGGSISTLGDLFRTDRKFNACLVVVA